MSGGCGVVPPLAYSACYRTPKCDLFSPNWKYDPHRAYFCKRFGKTQPEICPDVADPCESIHEPLRSLDYFSSPPMQRRTACKSKFRYMKSTLEPDQCAGKCKLSCSCCPGLPQLPCCYSRPKPKPYGDAVCGLCKTNDDLDIKRIHERGDDIQKRIPECLTQDDLPFTVHFTNPDTNTEPKPMAKSQVERCIHASPVRYLDTVYNDEYLDFFKLKSRDHLNLYRTRLAIEKRRPRPTIPRESIENKPHDMSQPIYINAKVVQMRNKGKGSTKSYQVCLPGPITIC